MKKLLALQGLRAIAAAMVVQVHAVDNYVLKALMKGADDPGMGRGFGGLGVQLFFCISGYIIFKSTDSLPAGAAHAINFIKKRLIRVAPIYWIITFFYIAKMLVEGNPASLQDTVKSMFFIPYTNDIGLMRPVVGVGWTLNYEMFFYALVTASIALFSRFRVVMIVAFLLAFILAGHLFAFEENPIRTTSLLLLANNWLMFFIAGLLVANLPKASSKLTLSWPLALLAACGAIMLHLVLSTLFTWYAAHTTWFSLAACASAVYLATNTQDAPLIDTWWSKLIVKAGDGSYSTYLVHGTILGFTARLAGKLTNHDLSMPFSILMVLVCSFIGYQVYKYIETPVIRLLSDRLLAPRPAAALREH